MNDCQQLLFSSSSDPSTAHATRLALQINSTYGSDAVQCSAVHLLISRHLLSALRFDAIEAALKRAAALIIHCAQFTLLSRLIRLRRRSAAAAADD